MDGYDSEERTWTCLPAVSVGPPEALAAAADDNGSGRIVGGAHFAAALGQVRNAGVTAKPVGTQDFHGTGVL